MERKNKLIVILLSVSLVGLFVLDLCCGSVWIPLHRALEGDSLLSQIVLDLRLPKAITAVLAGAALSISGLMMQTLFRNPLAGPYILGVSSGASLGVALFTMLSGLILLPSSSILNPLSLIASAIIGSAIVLLLMLAVGRKVKSSVSLLIVGLMVGSLASALIGVIQNFADPDSLKLFIVWTLGSLSGVGWGEMQVLLPIMVIGLVLSVVLVKPLNGLILGEDYARSLGIHIDRVRRGIVVTTGLLAGGITAFCGPIAFIGVAVPHIARKLIGSTNHNWTLPTCALVGANLILLCDLLSSLFVYPLPISTLSALVGAPVIIYVIVKKH
ncbi:MAG: iron ABC transporter permease [Paludibacteraceae bacterium]|nr:iron ABC transporter permease [Paludibacteraceae bacterium]